MGLTAVDVKVHGRQNSKVLKALVDTGFMGDLLSRPKILEGLDIDFRWERQRTIANGEIVKVRYGLGSIEIMGEITSADIEVWKDLQLPEGLDALMGAPALETLGLKVDPKAGKLEKTKLYLM